jgi:hypothetical protein
VTGQLGFRVTYPLRGPFRGRTNHSALQKLRDTSHRVLFGEVLPEPLADDARLTLPFREPASTCTSL